MAVAFNFGGTADGSKAERKLLMTYVNVATTGTPDWELIGSRIEESSIELNPEKKTVTDITGITITSVEKMEPSQSFSPFTITNDSKLALKLHNTWVRKAWSDFSKFEVLIVYKYVGTGTDDSYLGEKHSNCTIVPTSIGGSSTVDMPIEITYSNECLSGSVTFTSGKPSFTAGGVEIGA